MLDNLSRLVHHHHHRRRCRRHYSMIDQFSMMMEKSTRERRHPDTVEDLQYSLTNLVNEHETSCSLCSTWQWPRAFTHTSTTDTWWLVMITSSCQEYWRVREECKCLNERLIGHVCLTHSSWSADQTKDRAKGDAPSLCIDHHLSLSLFSSLSRQEILIDLKWIVHQREKSLMEKTCWADTAIGALSPALSLSLSLSIAVWPVRLSNFLSVHSLFICINRLAT